MMAKILVTPRSVTTKGHPAAYVAVDNLLDELKN